LYGGEWANSICTEKDLLDRHDEEGSFSRFRDYICTHLRVSKTALFTGASAGLVVVAR
jgi:hypothetical protein